MQTMGEKVSVTDPDGYEEIGGLARQMTAISSTYSGYLARIGEQGTTVAALKHAIEKGAVLDGVLLRSAKTILDQTNAFLPVSPRMNSLLGANRSLARIVEQIALPDTGLAAAFAGQGGVNEILRGAGLSNTLTASGIQLDMSRMLSASLVAQQRLAVLDRRPLGSLVGADATFRRSAAAHLGRLTRSYERLLAVATQPLLMSHLPILVAYPPAEYYRHVRTLESVTIPAADAGETPASVDASLDETAPSVDDLLRRFDESLCSLLSGARQALASKNPDHARHVTTSLRELFTQVLHVLAPDADVGAWTSQPGHYHGNRPTRRARLLYICRNINDGALSDFVEDDVRAAVSFVDTLSAGTHTARSRLSPAQLEAMVSRMEALLVFLLQIRNLE